MVPVCYDGKSYVRRQSWRLIAVHWTRAASCSVQTTPITHSHKHEDYAKKGFFRLSVLSQGSDAQYSRACLACTSRVELLHGGECTSRCILDHQHLNRVVSEKVLPWRVNVTLCRVTRSALRSRRVRWLIRYVCLD